MSFGGPIDSMINAHKSNMRLLKKRKKLKEIQDEYDAHSDPNSLHIPEGSIQEMGRFKARLRKERKRDTNRFILIVGITLVVILVILIWVVTADYSQVIDLID